MKALLGRKIGMSQMFSPEGEVLAVTLVEAVPNKVTLRRSEARDGYEAVQLGMVDRKGKYSIKKEFAIEVAQDVEELGVGQFEVGDTVEVSGVSKGKGFQGVVKRHHFKGGPASHGHRHVLRRPGSIGSRYPQHTRKGVRMAGRMGADRVTVKNLRVAAVDAEQNVLAIRGAVPGRRGAVLEIKQVD
ncbi:MAG: 50S ribosomal protein L3 [Candidatus Andersenbacteria bacterium]|nr:50S ribosomal protein L3 [bacterium]MDZ4225755.1 50S ribosomal protein L3 [Candidatus Andersenbacteria bacterium]